LKWEKVLAITVQYGLGATTKKRNMSEKAAQIPSVPLDKHFNFVVGVHAWFGCYISWFGGFIYWIGVEV
jgi:hypothetical protein